MTDKLTVFDHIFNLSSALTIPWRLFQRLRFAQEINRTKSKNSKGIAVPRRITISVGATPPAYLAMMWDEYNIQCCGGNDIRVIEGGIKYWYYDFWVSSNQLWVADRHARAYGWDVVTAPINDPKRGNSAADALKGPWRPWGANRPAVGGTMAITRIFGNLFGLLQPYQKAIRQQPGLRRHTTPTKRSLWQQFLDATKL